MNGKEYYAEPHLWIGRLSRSMTLALADLRNDRPRVAQKHLQDTIREFLRSAVPPEGLKADLRGDLRRR